MDIITISFAAATGLAALGISYFVGYLTGKDSANKTTYAAINSLVTDWNKLLKRMSNGEAPKGHSMRGVR